jgi:uncharacterized membrane protein YqjE
MNVTIPALLKSKRFWSAVLGLVMMVLINFDPRLTDNAEQLTASVLIIISLLVGGYAVEDAIEASAKK